MAERRYKLIGQSIPGDATYKKADLVAGEVSSWDAGEKKWTKGLLDGTSLDLSASYTWTGEHTHEADLILDNNVSLVGLKTDDTEHKLLRVDASNNQLLFTTALTSYLYGVSLRCYTVGGEQFRVDDSGIIVQDGRVELNTGPMYLIQDTTLNYYGLNFRSTDASLPVLRIDADDVTTEPALVQMFRQTDTTGALGFQICEGDGTSALCAEFVPTVGIHFHEELTMEDSKGIVFYQSDGDQGTTVHSTGIEVGNQDTAEVAFIDFHSTASNDYDFRMIATNGVNGTSGRAFGWLYGLTVCSALGATTDKALQVQNVTGSSVDILECYKGASVKMLVQHDGDVYNTNGTYGTISDRKAKKNIRKNTDGLDKLNLLNTVTYELLDEYDDADRELRGVVADEIKVVFPDLVTEMPSPLHGPGEDTTETIETVNMMGLVPVLVESIQEMDVMVKSLRRRIKELEDAAA